MNKILLIAGILNATAAILHIGCIYFGAAWYRFFGAGEQMALMAEKGSLQPTIITSGIVIVLSIWASYAFAAAADVKLPYMRPVLIVITSIYLIRAVVGGVLALMDIELGRSVDFWFWSSAISLIFASAHLLGLKQVWSRL